MITETATPRTAHADSLLTSEDVRHIEDFIGQLRGRYGRHWGFILDLKDNIAQVLRCIYSDAGSIDLNPVMNIPLIPNISWRVTAVEGEEPLFFDKVNMNDPRSFYLRKTVDMKQTVLFPIRTDANIGLLTMFSATDTPGSLTLLDVKEIHSQCGFLASDLSRVILKMEQRILNEAMANIRKRETPTFVSQLFNRLLDLPVLFLERIEDDRFLALNSQGVSGLGNQRLYFSLSNPDNTKFVPTTWGKLSQSPEIESGHPVTVVYLGNGDNAMLVMGELLLRGRTREDFTHYLDMVENLLNRPAHQISTLTFLLHLQHWIRSKERDINEIFQYIIDSLVPFIGADFGTLALLDRDKNKMMFVSQAGDMVNPLKTLPIDTNKEPESILAWVVKNNKPYLASDVTKDPFYRAFNPRIRSEVCVPIQVRGETIGLFSASGRRTQQFTWEELNKLKFFSDQIGISLFQAGVLDKAFAENVEARKIDQDIRFGFAKRTHAKNLHYNFGNLVGDPDGAMGKTFDAIKKINGSGRDDLNVLITGETGCGKEMVAFALHNSSRRGKQPMVVANFASFGGDPNLIQSELFGHEKGSFSGASNRRIGCIEQANDSTLLIDEVGDIVSSVQIKLLRVLQQSAIKTFQRLGGQETIKSNVRILAATHKDLWKEIQEERFREDLFYRLQTLVIRIPPLRERIEDVPLLVSHFSAKYKRVVPDLEISWTEDAMRALQSYSWPGNVRQLEGVINRALVLYADNGLVSGDAIHESLRAERRPMATDVSLFQQVRDGGDNAFWDQIREPYRERAITKAQLLEVVEESLRYTHGSYKQAARLMGVQDKDYNRFLDFLKNSGCKPDYREFR